MISSNLKRIIYTKKIRRALKNKALLENESLDKIGLIIDAESLEKKPELLDFYKLLGLKKEDLRIVACNSAVDHKDKIEILDPKEVSISGEFKSEGIKDFIQDRFDFIICYFSEKNQVGSLLVAEANGRMKFGNKPDQYGIYDLEIDSGDLDEFLEEVVKYYRIFKKKN